MNEKYFENVYSRAYQKAKEKYGPRYQAIAAKETESLKNLDDSESTSDVYAKAISVILGISSDLDIMHEQITHDVLRDLLTHN